MSALGGDPYTKDKGDKGDKGDYPWGCVSGLFGLSLEKNRWTANWRLGQTNYIIFSQNLYSCTPVGTASQAWDGWADNLL